MPRRLGSTDVIRVRNSTASPSSPRKAAMPNTATRPGASPSFRTQRKNCPSAPPVPSSGNLASRRRTLGFDLAPLLRSAFRIPHSAFWEHVRHGSSLTAKHTNHTKTEAPLPGGVRGGLVAPSTPNPQPCPNHGCTLMNTDSPGFLIPASLGSLVCRLITSRPPIAFLLPLAPAFGAVLPNQFLRQPFDAPL